MCCLLNTMFFFFSKYEMIMLLLISRSKVKLTIINSLNWLQNMVYGSMLTFFEPPCLTFYKLNTECLQKRDHINCLASKLKVKVTDLAALVLTFQTKINGHLTVHCMMCKQNGKL